MKNREKIDQWIDRVKDAYLNSDAVLTDSLLQEAIAETDSAPQLLEIAGMIAYRKGEAVEAIRLIEAAMFEIGLSISAQLTLANAWLQVGNIDSSRTTASFLVDVVDRVPCSMLADLTHILSALQEYELAIVACRKAFERHPDDDNAIFGCAFYMHRAGYPLELVKNVMLKALELKPTSQLYQVNLAVVYCSLNQWEAAYLSACRLSDQALSSIPCDCMVRQLTDLFKRFDDQSRLTKVKSN